MFKQIKLVGYVMSRKKNTKIKGNTNHFFNLFACNPHSNISLKEQIYRNIIFEAQQLNPIELDKFLKKIFIHPLTPKEVNCKYKMYKDIFKNYIYSFKSFNCQLVWFKNLFLNNKSTLNIFIDKKDRIDVAILNSNIKIALDLVYFIEKEICISLWSIELLTHLKKEFLNENTSEFLSKIKHDSNNNITNFYMQQLILKSESKEINNFTTNFVEALREMRDTVDDNHISDFADLASSYFLPYEFDQVRNVNERSLRNATCYSLIDQYLIFKTYIIEKILYGDGLTEFESKIVLEIINEINDDELKNILSDNFTLKNLDSKYLNIVKDYTNEEYNLTKIKIKTLLQNDSLSTSFIEIYARCNIYLSEVESTEPVLFEQISNSFMHILLADNDTLQSVEYIERVATKFKFSRWSIPILFHLNRIINEKKDKYTSSLKAMKRLGNKITPYSINQFNFSELAELLNIDKRNLSANKKLKLIDTKELDNESLNMYLQELKKTIKIYSDYLIEKSQLLLMTNQTVECLKLIVNSYLENNMYHIFLPIRDVLDKIQQENIKLEEIELPIICDIYSKKIDSYKDEFYLEIFQDFIDSFGEYEPSKIFEHTKELSLREIYFLKNVCTASILDVYPEYSCTENLKRERIKILDILIKHDLINGELYKKEKTLVFDELIFEKLKTDFDSSKIYVDIESLKNKKEDDYRMLYNLLLVAEGTKSEEIEYVQVDKKEDMWIPVANLSSTISKIYSMLFNDFVSNPNFGLDKYLSADIRHGVFIPHMRSNIENLRLLTEVTDGEYENNTFWLNKYPYIIQELQDGLNKALKDFSLEFDTALNSANNWFKINIFVEDEKNIPNDEGMFDFTLSKERLSMLQERLNIDLTFEKFFDIIISFMWEITENAAIEVKNRLNITLKQNLISSIDNLETTINNIRHNVPFKELLDTIQSARSYIHSDLERVLNWFNCVQDNSTEQYSLSSTLYACTDTFKNIASETNISLNFIEIEAGDLLFLTYRETRALMSSLYTALINSNTYKMVDSNIFIIIKENENNFFINIKNKVKLDKEISKECLLVELREKFSDRYCTLSTSEGGTGLYKIYNFLTTVSNRFTFDIDITEENDFIVKIGVKK